MAVSTVAQRKKILLAKLNDDKIRRIVLSGESGIGKTWTARAISNLARKRGLIDVVLWVFLNIENDSSTLRDSMDYQLSLLSSTAGLEVEDYNEQSEEKNQGDLQQPMSAVLEGKKLLIVLDDEGNKMNEEDVMSKLKALLNLNPQNYKVLITKRNIPGSDISEDDEMSRIEVKPLSKDESLSLLRERVGTKAYEVMEALAKNFVEKTKYKPAAIILMAKAFCYFAQQDSGVHILERSLEEASNCEIYNITDLLRSGYDLVPNSILFDCCWGGSHFLHHGHRIHYNELIAYWMIEGYLGQVDMVEKAYESGHRVLMELIDCQILRTVEADYIIVERPTSNLVDVVMKRAMLNSDDCYRRGFFGAASLGLAFVFGDAKWEEGLGRTRQKDGVIKALPIGRRGHQISTLLFDESSFIRAFPLNFFESRQELQVLGIFNPTLNMLPPSSSMMHNLHMAVLRGCHFMNRIEQTLGCEKLTVLEISGPSSLTTIPDEFFKHIPHLQSLNLSFLQIDMLPSSLYNLSELKWLVLRGCSRFKCLQSLRKCKNLVVLDLSGATSLENIQDRTFSHNQELQMLDFSKTKIKSLPLVNSLKNLSHLLLSECLELTRLRGINAVTTLQILDLSDARNFNEFHDQSLEGIVGLKILDLSGTALHHLPSNIGNPRHLFLGGCTQLEDLSCVETLRDIESLDLTKSQLQTLPSLSHLPNLRSLLMSCSKLVKLPDLNALKKLEVLDLSGCCDLEDLHDTFFEQMSCLWKLDLSQTKINCLPSSLSDLTNLRHLLLKSCSGLKALPPLESLSKLEELNLCGISCLRETGADFLKSMIHLQILDLSETLLQNLPSMLNVKNLRQLYLRGCLGLKTVPDLETLTKLEVLDLSGTAVGQLESLDDFIYLRELMLGDFPVPEEFQQLENSPSAAQELPYGVSESPNMIEEPNQCGWGIYGLPAGTVGENNFGPLSMSSSKFLQLLKSNPSLWKTTFKKFHFCVQPTVEQDGKCVVPVFRHDSTTFIDIYFKSRQFFEFEEQGSLEIRGFHHPAKGIENVISHIDCVFLIENAFDRWFSDLSASYLKVPKGCWIETCSEMESFFYEKDVKEVEKLSDLEVLWVNNCANLNFLFHGNWQSDPFQNLNHLYLDCCPKLSFVFSSSHIPINLKVVHIKFCDKLESVFEEASPHPELPYLDTLYLWELPKLKSIGCALPSLQTLKVWQCPNLAEFEENVKLKRFQVPDS